MKRSSRGRGERGQALLWFALMLPFLLGVVGVAADLGTAYVQRAALQTIADDAARTGAERLDQGVYYGSDRAVLDPAAAQQAAMTYLETTAPGTTAQVQADQQRVTVTVRRTVPLPFLAAVGLRTATVGAEGVATVAQRGD